MTKQNLVDNIEEMSIHIFGIRFMDGTVSDALTPSIVVAIAFLLYYCFFKLLRMRWGIQRSLAITILTAYIVPLIAYLTIKHILPTFSK